MTKPGMLTANWGHGS